MDRIRLQAGDGGLKMHPCYMVTAMMELCVQKSSREISGQFTVRVLSLSLWAECATTSKRES